MEFSEYGTNILILSQDPNQLYLRHMGKHLFVV